MVEESLVWRFNDAQSRLVTQASDFSLATISAMVDNGSIDPSPEYQRRRRWAPAKQSALIESFLLNVPVPPVYLAEEEFGVYSVIDGKQRITAIHDFMTGRLELRNLPELPELHGMTIHDLPREMASALRVRPYIRAVTLLKQSDPGLKYEVFIRLNRGGETLTSQEVRNVAFRGPFNDMVLELTETPFLRKQFNIDDNSQRYRKMEDAEIVLRFLALSESWERYDGNLARTMDEFMAHYRDDREAAEIFRKRFLHCIKACEQIWGDYAFRRSDDFTWRSRAVLGMYDAAMLAVWLVGPEKAPSLLGHQDAVLYTADLFTRDPGFAEAVSVSTNTAARLHYRVTRVAEMLARAS